MLQIKPCLDEKLMASYCKKSGRLPGPEFYLYVTTERDKLIAACLFEVCSDLVNAIWYEDESRDATLFDAVLRSGFNYAAGQGIPTGCLPEDFRAAHADIFARLNYPDSPTFNIANFFRKYKSCNINN